MADLERLVQLAAGSQHPCTMRRHIFLCSDQTKPKCCTRETGVASLGLSEGRLAELGLLDRVYRTKANCLRVCEGGPDRARVSRRRLVSLGDPGSAGADHSGALIGGRVVEEYAFARSPVCS